MNCVLVNDMISSWVERCLCVFRTIERDCWEMEEMRIRGMRRIVMMTTTAPMPKRIVSWILLGKEEELVSVRVTSCWELWQWKGTYDLRSSLTFRSMGKGRMINAISVTILKTACSIVRKSNTTELHHVQLTITSKLMSARAHFGRSSAGVSFQALNLPHMSVGLFFKIKAIP